MTLSGLKVAAFGRLLKTHLFSEYQRMQRTRGFGDNALYKSTFYLLTYLLTSDPDFKVITFSEVE